MNPLRASSACSLARTIAALVAVVGAAAAAPSPSVQGLQTGAWNVISDNDLNPNQAVVDFGDVAVGASSDRNYRFRNIGDGFFNWTGFSSSDPQFTLRSSSGGAQGLPVPIVGGDHRDFRIRFTPATPGTVTSTITLHTNLGSINAEYTFAVTAVGRAPDAQLAGRQGASGAYLTIVSGDTSPRFQDGTDFNFIPVGSSAVRDFRLTNTGNETLDPGSAFFVGGDSGDFSVNGLGLSNLGAGNSRDFTITFTPSSTGIKTTTLHFVSDDPDENPYTFALRGEGVAFPNIQVWGREAGVWNKIEDGDLVPDQAVVRFADTLLGKSATRLFRIENTGNAALDVSSVSSGDAAFTIPGPPTLVPAGESRDFAIAFAPAVPGAAAATITVRSDAPGDADPYTFALTGTGIAPDARISGRPGSTGSFDNIVDGETTPRTVEGTLFPMTPVGNFTERYFKLSNDGNAALDPGSAFMSGPDAADFSVRGLSLAALAAGGSREFEIRLAPGSPGTKTATFNLVSDDPDENPYTFVVQGEAVAFPNINVRGLTGAGLPFDIADGDHTPDQDVTDFGDVDLGGSGTRLFRIENTGNAVLNITSITSDDPEFTIPGPPTLVGAGAQVDFAIVYTPAQLGADTGIITIESDMPGDGASYTFALTGVGTGPEMAVDWRHRRGDWIGILDGSARPDPRIGTDFGPVNISAGAVEHTFRVRNTGNAALNINGREFTGAGAGHFSVSGLLAGNPFATIKPGAERQFTIAFDPSGEGSKRATFAMATNDPDEDPFDFAVAGTGIARPEIRVFGPRPGALPIPPRREIFDGDGVAGSDDGTLFPALSIAGDSISRTFRIENPGDGVLEISSVSVDLPGEYGIIGAPSSVAPGGHGEFDIVFDPATGGQHDAVVTIASNAWMPGGLTFHQQFTFAVAGYGWDNVSAAMRVTGQGINARLEDSFEFLLALDLGYGIAFDSGVLFDFDYTVNLNPRWEPVADNDPDTRPGNGTDFGSPNIEYIDPIAFSNVKSIGLFRIENLGATPLEVSEVSVDSDHYFVRLDRGWFGEELPAPLVVGPGESEVLRVIFNPELYGRHDAVITLTTNAPDHPIYRIRVTGFGDSDDGPEIEVPQFSRRDWPIDLRFHTDAGVPETQQVEIINRGNEILTLDIVPAVDPEHFTVSALPDFVLPGQSETFDVTFTSDAIDAYLGAIHIGHNDPDGDPDPMVLEIEARVRDPSPSVNVYGPGLVAIENGSAVPSAGNGTDFGTADASGGGITRTFFIENTDFRTLAFNSFSTGSASFRIESAPAEVAPGETEQLVLTFLPTGAGEEVSTLQIDHRFVGSSGSGAFYDFAIGGTSTAVVSAPPEFIHFSRTGASVTAVFTNSPTETYAFDYSFDGAAWFTYEAGIQGLGIPIARTFPAGYQRVLLRVRQE